MIDKWGDTKRWLVEDILIYGLVFFFGLVWDFIFNLMVATGIHEIEGLHPYSIGGIQFFLLAFSALQIIRKISQLKYYV